MKISTLSNRALCAIVILSVLFTSSCTKNSFDLNKLEKTAWNPSVAIPLVYSSLTISNLLLKNNSGGQITTNDSNFCTLIYNKTLLSARADSIIQLPDQQCPPFSVSLTSLQVNALGTSNSITVSSSQVEGFDAGSDNTQVDTVIFKGGTLSLTLNSTFQNSGQIVITIPAATKNGVPFSTTVPFTYAGTTPVVTVVNDSLAGYFFDMSKGGYANNAFLVNYTVTLNGSGTLATTSESISVSGGLSNLKFEKIFGFLGTVSLFPSTSNDTIPISIFKNYTGNGQFNIVNPSIKITLSNSYGLPVNASLPVLERFTPPSTVTPVTGVPNPLPVLYPSFSQLGQSISDSFILTKSNSNIYSIISNYPKYFIFNAAAVTNISGYAHNFVIDSSRFKVSAQVNLPLYGSAGNFTLVDTLKFSPGQFITTNVQSALLNVYTLNGFPIDVNMQLYFTDSTYHILDSLVIPNQLILKSGALNSSGMVVAPTPNTYTAAFTETRLANLAKARYVLMKSVEWTTNGGATNVKIYSNYSLGVQIGMEVQVKEKL